MPHVRKLLCEQRGPTSDTRPCAPAVASESVLGQPHHIGMAASTDLGYRQLINAHSAGIVGDPIECQYKKTGSKERNHTFFSPSSVLTSLQRFAERCRIARTRNRSSRRASDHVYYIIHLYNPFRCFADRYGGCMLERSMREQAEQDDLHIL